MVKRLGIENAVVDFVWAGKNGVSRLQAIELPLDEKRNVAFYEEIDLKAIVNVRRKTGRGGRARITFAVVLHLSLGKIGHRKITVFQKISPSLYFETIVPYFLKKINHFM